MLWVLQEHEYIDLQNSEEGRAIFPFLTQGETLLTASVLNLRSESWVATRRPAWFTVLWQGEHQHADSGALGGTGACWSPQRPLLLTKIHILDVFQRLKYKELACKNTWQHHFRNSLFEACVKFKGSRRQILHYLLDSGTKNQRYQITKTIFFISTLFGYEKKDKCCLRKRYINKDTARKSQKTLLRQLRTLHYNSV